MGGDGCPEEEAGDARATPSAVVPACSLCVCLWVRFRQPLCLRGLVLSAPHPAPYGLPIHFEKGDETLSWQEGVVGSKALQRRRPHSCRAVS